MTRSYPYPRQFVEVLVERLGSESILPNGVRKSRTFNVSYAASVTQDSGRVFGLTLSEYWAS